MDLTIEVSGAAAADIAAELHGLLVRQGVGDVRVSPVEVQRSAELVIAAISLVFSGVGTATAIWDWWASRRREGVTVRILLDGRQVDLSTVDADEFEILLEPTGGPHDD